MESSTAFSPSTRARALACLLGIALASGGLSALLGLAAGAAVRDLAATPAAWWGMGQLSSAVVALLSGAGSLAALWHLVSALVALSALPRQDRHGRAGRLLEQWGAPLVRRIAAGALVIGLSSSPALAAQQGAADDLGWQPTSSAQSEPPAAQSPDQSPDQPPDQPPADRSDPGRTGAEPGGPGGPQPSHSQSSHTVGPGESLWSITAEHLAPGADDAEIAQAWPELYQANSQTIGDDPGLIAPGTALRLPDGLAEDPTADPGTQAHH